jgi:DNA-binding GntR family transcriptional regulator
MRPDSPDEPPLQAEPIARRIARALRQAIVTMRVKPGEMLSEQDFAQRFGVSRQPVREAFIKLSESGLVRVLPQRGTQVVKISAAAVEDARFVREAIECALARRAARAVAAAPASLGRLSALLAEQERAAAAVDGETFFGLDEEFHRALAALAGRPTAWRTIEDVKAQMDRVRYLDMTEAQPMAVVIRQHRAVLAALARGDADAAERAMRVHLSQIEKTLPVLSRRYPEMFEAPSGRPGAEAAAPRQRRSRNPVAKAPATSAAP